VSDLEPDLVLFLMGHLPEAEWDQLDQHRPKRFHYLYYPPDRAGEERGAHREGCAVCSGDPLHRGYARTGTDWIEDWPCRHLCELALPYADQPGFHPWFRERLTLGAHIHP
jgi:hypothetical protein